MKSNKISKTPNSCQAISTLNEDLIAEILSRLPVKSLLKFRCVSKSWCSLISTKQFIKTHLEKSIKNPNFTHHSVISTFLQSNYHLKLCSLNSLLYEPTTEAVDLIYPMRDKLVSARVVGCCNGLCCILIDGKDFFLWNLSTKKCKKLPCMDPMVNCGFKVTKYGFGFDECGGDYKVFGIISVFRLEGRYEPIAKIYSLKSNSWRKLENFKDSTPFDGAGMYVGGRLHWGRSFADYRRLDIVSFDLGNAVSGVVEQPNFVEGCFDQSFGVLGGCLCILCSYPKVRMDFWVLKQYGVKDSWDKVVSIPYVAELWHHPHSMPVPLGIAVGGEIVFVCGTRFMIYDPKNNLVRHPEINNFGEFFVTDVYIESLVSPFADGGPEVQNPGQWYER